MGVVRRCTEGQAGVVVNDGLNRVPDEQKGSNALQTRDTTTETWIAYDAPHLAHTFHQRYTERKNPSWSLYDVYLLASQVRCTVCDSGLCCCVPRLSSACKVPLFLILGRLFGSHSLAESIVAL